MENTNDIKLTLAQRILKTILEQFKTVISSFIFGGFLIFCVFQFLVLPSKNELIEVYKSDRDNWKERYFNSPNEIKSIYQMMDDIKNNRMGELQIKEEYSKKIETMQKDIDKLEQKTITK